MGMIAQVELLPKEAWQWGPWAVILIMLVWTSCWAFMRILNGRAEPGLALMRKWWFWLSGREHVLRPPRPKNAGVADHQWMSTVTQVFLWAFFIWFTCFYAVDKVNGDAADRREQRNFESRVESLVSQTKDDIHDFMHPRNN